MDILLKCYICETKVVNLDAHFIECHSLENDVEENEPSQEFSTTSGRHFCYLKKCTGECKSNPNLDKIQTEPSSQITSQVTTNKKGKEKPRHARRSFTQEQIKVLKSSYGLNKYCTPEERIKLSQLSGLSEQSIQKWFKKQQHKAKLLKRDSNKGHGVKCNVCEMIFSTEGSLKLHVIAIHENQRDYKCDICGKSFSIAIRLKTHIKKVHEGKI